MALTTKRYVTAEGERWRDSKRFLWPLGLIVPLIPFLVWLLVQVTGQDIFWWAGPIVVFGVIPLIDLLAGIDPENPPAELMDELENDKFYRWVIYLFLPLQYASLTVGAYLLGGGSIAGSAPLDVADKLGLSTALAMVSGIAINTAHELGHKKEEHERWFARIALAPTFYGHFFIEHNRGHHVRVATPDDPASSRLGESLYEFLPRTVTGSLRSAWELEAKRFERLGTSRWTLKNDVLNSWAFSVVLWGGLVLAFGAGILPYLVVQGILGFCMLEVVNYLEHYGMLREKTDSGRYERVRPDHSWNSNNIGTNVFLYHLQRHSDHHANPTRRYQTLRDFKDAPVLPTGYAGMMVLACLPPLWRRVMDKRVIAHFDGDVTRANLHPRNRDKTIARYGRGAGAGHLETAGASAA